MTFLYPSVEIDLQVNAYIIGAVSQTVWSRPSQALCVVYIWIVRSLMIQCNSGNSGSLWACFFWGGWGGFPYFPGILDFREDFYLSVGTGCLLSPVFCSRCVCQLRPQLWCLEDMNTLMPISCVVSHTFGNGIVCFGMVRRFENALVSPIKVKFGTERCACFSHFLIFVMDVCI